MIFSAVTTSMSRSIGIPTRTVTNMGSAHERTATNRDTQPGPNRCFAQSPLDKSGEKVWNFHVWVEAYQQPGQWNIADGTWNAGPGPIEKFEKVGGAGSHPVDPVPEMLDAEQTSLPSKNGVPGNADALYGFHEWNGKEWLPIAQAPIVAVDLGFAAFDPKFADAVALAAEWTKLLAAQIEAQNAACDKLKDFSVATCRKSLVRVYGPATGTVDGIPSF